MTRRQILTQLMSLATLTATGSRMARAEDPPAQFTDWVRRFYLTQLAVRARQEGHATPETESNLEPTLSHPLRDYLTAEMQTLYDNAQNRQMPPEVAATIQEGPILHEIFGWGALPNRPIELVAVTKAPWWKSLTQENLALVTLNIAGNERDLTLKGHYHAPTFSWQIEDIDYGEGSDETLRERLESTATWPKRN